MFRNNHSLIKSFLSAFRGIKHALGERNFFIQVVIGSLAITLAFILELSFVERAVIIVFSVLVLVVEIINTAFEKLLDKIIKEENPEIAKIKELMAAAVLIFSAAAFLIGLWIFGRAIFFR
ncbi:MAG: diacylglycerol kinase [bacterium]|nr:diacylglycerol kinase [bacterium]